MDVWRLLLMVLFALGALLPVWIVIQFALIGDTTRDEIHGDD